uniref:Calcineurin-like phosphoesterase domain-containing protein n=1 Tax=Guillardia theta TaxID=55529 RepID=A0A7S4JSD2_GUITH|mmetsp:Transcript_18343/g.60242  ORF Transcript_18343/g.60242 Transcript_18343/m.60242 type:complete len:340 (+) Transcript_18343:51-1070(+)
MCEIYPAFYDYRSHVDELLVLLVSDVKSNLSNIHKLAEFLTAQSIHVDMIWVTGNLIFLDNSDHVFCCRNAVQLIHEQKPEMLSASEGDTSAIISALENIQCRVAYVPGRHDPPTTQGSGSQLPRLTSNSCNLYHRCLRIAQDLVLLGFDYGKMPMTEIERHMNAENSLQQKEGSDNQQHLMCLTSRMGQDFIMQGDSVVILSNCNISHDAEDQIGSSPTRPHLADSWTNVISKKQDFSAKFSLICFGSDDPKHGDCTMKDESILEDGSQTVMQTAGKVANKHHLPLRRLKETHLIEFDGLPCIYPGAFSEAVNDSFQLALTFWLGKLLHLETEKVPGR